MTKLLRFYPFILLFGLVLFAQGCVDDEDPLVENEEEIITSVNLTLFALDPGNEDVVLGFLDEDGDGSGAPMMSQIGELKANSSYRGQVSFGGPDGSIDSEIISEGTDHQVFYEAGAGLDLTVMYTDSDALGQPVGLQTTFTTGGFGSGNLTITLKHEPAKDMTLTVDNPDAAGGSTDAEVVFNVAIQ